MKRMVFLLLSGAAVGCDAPLAPTAKEAPGRTPSGDSGAPKEADPAYRGKPASEWVKLLRGGDTVRRTEAAKALGDGFGPPELGGQEAEAVAALTDAVKQSRAVILRFHALKALARMGERAAHSTPVVIDALRDDDDAVRGEAVGALGEVGRGRTEAADALIATLGNDAHPTVRGLAAFNLGKLGLAGRKVIAALTGALRDEHPSVRSLACLALGELGPGAAEAVHALATALTDKEGLVREGAAMALGLIGPGAADAVPALTAALKDEVTGVREKAARALRKIDPAAAGQAGIAAD